MGTSRRTQFCSKCIWCISHLHMKFIHSHLRYKICLLSLPKKKLILSVENFFLSCNFTHEKIFSHQYIWENVRNEIGCHPPSPRHSHTFRLMHFLSMLMRASTFFLSSLIVPHTYDRLQMSSFSSQLPFCVWFIKSSKCHLFISLFVLDAIFLRFEDNLKATWHKN